MAGSGSDILLEALADEGVRHVFGIPGVHNLAVYDALRYRRPLMDRVMTVTGPGIREPRNVRAPLGASLADVVAFCGGLADDTTRMVAGGPMMGKTVFSDEVPVVKGSSGIVILRKEAKKEPREYSCVRCAKCIDICPAFLEPTSLAKMAKRGAWEEAELNNVMSCIECGSCVFSCPAHIPLIEYIRRAKHAVLAAKAKAKA